MNLINVFVVILLSLVVFQPTLTSGADPVEFIRNICNKCPITTSQNPTFYPRLLCTKFMSPFAGEIASVLGLAAIKSVELEISSIDYLKKYKPPRETTAYMKQKIQMAINCVSTTSVNHDISVSVLKSMVPKPSGLCNSAFEGVVLTVYTDMISDMETIEKCIASFDPPESPLKTDVVSRLQEIVARTIVAKCVTYSFSQQYKKKYI